MHFDKKMSIVRGGVTFLVVILKIFFLTLNYITGNSNFILIAIFSVLLVGLVGIIVAYIMYVEEMKK